jgi:hypothetical protein
VFFITLSCNAFAAFLFQAASFNTGTRWNWLSSPTAARGWLGARPVCPSAPLFLSGVALGVSCGQGDNRPVGGVVPLRYSTAPEGGRHVTADHGVNIFEEVSGLMVPAKA